MLENCSDKRRVVQTHEAPSRPNWDSERVGVWMDKHGPVSVVNVTWKIMVDGKKCKNLILKLHYC